VRIGYGWDSHEFKRGLPLKIGGVELPHPQGLAGHSDGDVLLHAITDALLGAIAAGDIGTHFPPGDPRWKGADSVTFLNEAMRLVRAAGYTVANVDSTLILAKPQIGPHAAKIQARVAELLAVNASAVGVKAKTPEGMGTEKAAIAHVAVLLVEKPSGKPGVDRAAEDVPQPVIDEVFEQVVKTVPAPGTHKSKSRR
jgi:2-C-methyl-D-erythritol 2,4-cyclodiphosphate synthase